MRNVAAACARLLSAAFVLAWAAPSPAAGPATRPGGDWRAAWAAKHDRLVADLTGGDDARARAAAAEVRDAAVAAHANQAFFLQTLLDARRYAEADAACVDVALAHPADAGLVAGMQKMRVAVLLAEGEPAEALSAAKGYYDVAPLKDTADAINQVALCLARARPQEKGIVRRFKRQQVAGAATQPATPAEDLGEPILAGVEVDAKPFEAAIAAVQLDDYQRYVAKGNLLLVSGRAKEARAVFEEAYDLAEGKDVGPAIENVARAIRAESGCVGPANAYLLSLQEKKN